MKCPSSLFGALLLGATLVPQSADAAVLVNFSSADYAISGNVVMAGWTSGVAQVPFSESDYRNPSTAGYDATQPSARFYGGAAASGAAGLTTYRISNKPGGWDVDVITVTSTTAASSVSALMLWKQSDFLALSSGSVELNATTGISLSLQAGASNRTTEARLVIQKGGAYYISSLLGSAAGTQVVNISVANPTTLSWFHYDPVTNLAVMGSSAVLVDLQNITSVGIYMRGTAVGAAAPAIIMGGLTINGEAIPEPTSLALLTVVLAGGAMQLIRRSVG